MRERFYRVSYNGIGIYQALKEAVDIRTWKMYLNSDIFTWLPSPKNYPPNSKSYFTEDGLDMFKHTLFPILEKHLVVSKIVIKRYYINDIDDIIYRDKYQVITNPDPNTLITAAIEALDWFDPDY